MAAADGTLEEKTASATRRSRKLEAHRPRRRRVAGQPRPGRDRRCDQRRNGEIVDSASEVIGRATNNVAEYRALILGIERAAALGATELDLVGDSELIVKQVRGEYKVKDPNMKPLHAAVDDGAAPLRRLVDPPRQARPQRRRRPPRQRGARRRRLIRRATNLTTGRRLRVALRAGARPASILRLHAAVAQLARASACHAEGRGFESHQPLPVGSARRCPSMCGEALRSKRHGNGGPREGFRSSPVLA